MALKRATILITGNVRMVGFRTFIKNLADPLNIKGYAINNPDGSVTVECEGESIEKLCEMIQEKTPSFAKIEKLDIKYGNYTGEFIDFKRLGDDIPKKGATLDDLLEVMISFDSKAEKVNIHLERIHYTLKNVETNTNKMLEKQDTMLEKQDTILKITENGFREIKNELKSIKEDTSQIREDTSQIREDTSQIKKDTSQIKEDTSQIKEDTSQIKENTSLIPPMKEDTSEIRYNTHEISEKISDKYEELSREIATMKVTMSKIEAKVMI